jgi:transcription antitermination factor NusB
LQVLFQLEYTPGDPEEAFARVCANFDVPPKARGFAKRLVLEVCEHRDRLDAMIREASRNWRLERMSRVDRNILRIGALEVAFVKEVPAKVAIDEAVEIGKTFGAVDSAAFINGVLDNIYNQLNPSAA